MTITPLYAGLLALWFLLLSWRVVARRQSGRINLGDGGDADMQRRIRGHANFAEYVPLILVLMLGLEVGGTAPWILHLFGITLVLARVLHGIALSFSEQFFIGRFWGTLLTFIVLALAALLCVYRGVMTMIL